jgi:hypothetical protein
VIDRFWDKVLFGNCWQWTGTRGWHGYGIFRNKGKDYRAHRVSYERVTGPIPSGLYLDHLCQNVLCVRPSHLEPVTPRENVLRSVSPASVNAFKTHCKMGHKFNHENTRVARGQRLCRACDAIRSRNNRKVTNGQTNL